MLQSQRVSRSGLVFGSSLLTTAADPNGSDMNRHREVPTDVWYDMEHFQMDHIAEVLAKLSENRLDDEIWGKVMVMERARRVAKAYLRKTTLIVDGSDEEFDGRTLGFNHFPNSMRDDHTLEIKSKIGDGVIIKMDYQGNIKAMARGSTPIFVQGWKDTRNTCMGQRLVRLQGRLKTSLGGNEDEQVLKIFDMRRFKSFVESDSVDFKADARHLLMKTCVRVALVKDGGGTDPMKTPCWFMIINLVALDMLVTKMPELTSAGALASLYGGADKVPRFPSQTSILPPGSDIYTNPAALTQIIAAAVQQANHHSSKQPIDVDHLTKLASSISVQQQASSFNRKSRPARRTFSDSDDSPESSSDHRSRGRSVCTLSSAASSSGVSGFSSHNRREKTPRSRASNGQSIDAIYRLQEAELEDDEESKYARGPLRPRLTDDVFLRQNPAAESKPQHQLQSSTSDYDSQKELDSGSWSSNTRSALSSNSQDPQRSYSPSLPSETEESHQQPLQPNVIEVNNSEDEENAVVTAKSSRTRTCLPTTLPERTASTTTTESAIPPSRRPEELRRANLPVSHEPTTTPTTPQPTVPSSDDRKGTFIGRQLRNLWNNWTVRSSHSAAQSERHKPSLFDAFRRRPRHIPEQPAHDSPRSSSKCSANAERQLPDVPRAFCAAPLHSSSSSSGLYQSPLNLRCGSSTRWRHDDFVALQRPPSGRRGLRRCNDAEYGGFHVVPRGARPEDILMY